MLEVPYLPPAVPGGDRSGRFVATGVILSLIALLGGCMTAMIPVSVVMQRQMAQRIVSIQAAAPPGSNTTSHLPANFGNPDLAPLIVGGLIYMVFTVAAGWLGIAAFLKRRYVRPLVLVFGTHGLIVGVISTLALAIVMPMQISQLNTGGPNMTGVIIGIVFTIGLSLALMIGVPTTLLLLMRPDAVRETAEHYDLRGRWTDGVPVKLLGLVLTLAVFALFDLMTIANPKLPLVFTVITGPVVIVLYLAHAALMAMAAVLVYRRRMLGWTVALVGFTVPVVLFALSSALLPTEQFLVMANSDANTLDLARQNESTFRLIWGGVSLAFLVATVVYLRRMRPLVELPVATAVSE